MAFSKSCGPCGGTGYYGLNFKDLCKVCGGMGVIQLEGNESDYKSCGPCGGSGYFGINFKDTCTVCHGAGVVRPAATKAVPRVTGVASRPIPADSSVFLVHGQNHAVRDQIDLFLTKELGVNVTVMAAGPHQGRTLPEKFEEVAARCSFAVFLLTADDVLQAADGRSVRRPRQNVVLEVGYFWGALGRRGRVAFLVESHPDMELPSDIQGVGWIPITADLGETKLRLRQEYSLLLE